jgi:hypothetical protein
MTSGHGHKKQEAKARSLKAVLRDTLVRPAFRILLSLFQGSSFFISTPASLFLVRLQLTGVTHDLDTPSLAVRG